MKNLILGAALALVCVACASENKMSVDAGNAPDMDCTSCGVESDCSGCPEMGESSECSGEKTECAGDDAKVCPITGATYN